VYGGIEKGNVKPGKFKNAPDENGSGTVTPRIAGGAGNTAGPAAVRRGAATPVADAGSMMMNGMMEDGMGCDGDDLKGKKSIVLLLLLLLFLSLCVQSVCSALRLVGSTIAIAAIDFLMRIV
jgi:hypothetical protein